MSNPNVDNYKQTLNFDTRTWLRLATPGVTRFCCRSKFWSPTYVGPRWCASGTFLWPFSLVLLHRAEVCWARLGFFYSNFTPFSHSFKTSILLHSKFDLKKA